MISHDVIPLFLQYFMILIDDGNEYPIDSVRYGFLEVLKGLVFNMTETSSEFCFECCKQGLITLMAVHLQYLQGLFWLPLEVKGYAEQKAVGIMYNCAKRPEPLIYAKVQNTFEIMSEFRHEMVKEVGPERMEFLTFIAFSVTYMAEEDQLGSLKVHQSLINYIVENINKAVASNKDIKLKRGSYSLLEMFDGLAQLARNDDNAAAILKCPESVDYITKFLNSDQESNRKASLQLICNICQSKRNKGKVQKQLELFDLLTNMRINDPNQDLRLMADETCKFLSSPAEKSLSKLFKLRK
ncbi:uncharacterized protein LOC143451286 [Clavelina lepadiformis]|uniref:uncharacterized protein LOC143451285 n=1 Tax=Clavelina lepadiformis TaxID=159417 RepID=UPI0040427DC8